jgi:pimeloyl-ACP methyl ester carboxylesterase/class 3 adenylate cyclase
MPAVGVPEIRYARADGLHLAYWEVGEGPRVFVLVSPWLSQVEVVWEDAGFAKLVERLARHGRVVAFDRRGAGLSDPMDRPATLEERAEDLTAVLDAVGAPRASLLCLNEGGTMAIVYAAAHPERVDGLVLYGAYAAPTKSDELWWAPGPESYELMAQFVEEHWGTGDLLAGLAPSRADDAAFHGWLAKLERLAASPRSAGALVRLMGATDVSAILPEISVPTLVLHRADDPYVDVRHAHYLAERIPNAQLTIVPGTDHFFTVGDLESLTTPTLEFLTGEAPEIEADRFLTTVLITDIVDSTRTAAGIGDDRWTRLLADHFAACREQVARHRGEFVKTTGDGVLAIFDGPARAVRCGLAIRATSHDAGLSLRAGVHTGECERLSDDLAGVAVHIAARTCAIAEGEELIATSTVRDLAVGSMLRFDPRGTRELKGVPGSWSVFAVDEAA